MFVDGGISRSLVQGYLDEFGESANSQGCIVSDYMKGVIRGSLKGD